MAEDPFIALLAPVVRRRCPTGQPGRWRMVAAANPFTRAEAQAYAGCREAFRRSPELRRRLAGRDVPAGALEPGRGERLHRCSGCGRTWSTAGRRARRTPGWTI